MAAWPSIVGPTGLDIIPGKPIASQTSSAGYTMSFAGATATKKTINLSWDAMPTADKDTLESFFETNAGGNFTFENPDPASTETFTVMFGTETLPFKYKKGFISLWELNLTLVEA